MPALVGERLSQLMLDCLTVMDDGFGTRHLVREDSVETGLNYLAAVKMVLEEIRI